MSRQSRRRFVWTGFVLAMLGMLPAAPSTASAGLAALDAYHVGRYHLANGDREQALESFNDALRLNPQFVQAYVARGKLYAELGQHESALVDLNFALRLQPTHAEAFAYRGYALMSIGQVSKAMPDLDMALRLDPSYARVHFLRGQALGLLGDQQSAAASIAQARRLDPTLDITRVVSASADGGLQESGVQLSGGDSPQRTPVMSELMPVESAPQPTDVRFQGRVVPYNQHPVLADVEPPAISRSSGGSLPSRHDLPNSPALATRNNPPLHPGASPPSLVTLPDITSEPLLSATDSGPADASKTATAEESAPSTTSDDKTDAKTDAVVIDLPATVPTKPEIVVEAVPQLTPSDDKIQSTAVAGPAPGSNEASAEDGDESAQKPVESDLAAADSKLGDQNSGEEQATESTAEQHFPSFGPPIFVMPREVVVSDDPPAARSASEILRGAASSDLMLPEKPSSMESDRRLQLAVEAARAGASLQVSGQASDAAMAVVGDDLEAESPVATQITLSPEQKEKTQAAFRRGTELESDGKIAEALAAYGEAIQIDPNDPEILCRRGHLLLEGLRTAEALADFERAILVAPGLANGYFGRAHVNYITEEYADAAFDYSICLRLDDQHAQALIERGHCYSLLGKLSEAAADRRAALDLDPSLAKSGPKYAMGVTAEPIPAVLMPGATAFAGDVEGVLPATAARNVELPTTAIVDDFSNLRNEMESRQNAISNDKSAFGNLFPIPADEDSTALATDDAQAEAEAEIAVLTRQLSDFPGDKDRYFRRARRFCDVGRLDDALVDLNAVLRFDGGHLEALKLRADVQLRLHHPEAAVVDLDAALKQTPDDVGALTSRSAAHAELGNVAAALADLDRVLALEPKNAAAFLERSRLHAESGAFSEAQADRDAALKLDGSLR